jgi:hypothetical protein
VLHRARLMARIPTVSVTSPLGRRVTQRFAAPLPAVAPFKALWIGSQFLGGVGCRSVGDTLRMRYVGDWTVSCPLDARGGKVAEWLDSLTEEEVAIVATLFCPENKVPMGVRSDFCRDHGVPSRWGRLLRVRRAQRMPE